MNDIGILGSKIVFMPYHWLRTPDFLAKAMSMSDMEQILIKCGGDFSNVEENTAQAVSLFAARLGEKRDEQKKKAQEAYKARSTTFHNRIIDEIVDLMEGSGEFRTCDIQIAAVNRGNGFPVRTRQMYASHIRREVEEDGRITHSFTGGDRITVIYKDGHSGFQKIPYRGIWHVK